MANVHRSLMGHSEIAYIASRLLKVLQCSDGMARGAVLKHIMSYLEMKSIIFSCQEDTVKCRWWVELVTIAEKQ